MAYPKIPEPILPNFQKCRFLHTGFDYNYIAELFQSNLCSLPKVNRIIQLFKVKWCCLRLLMPETPLVWRLELTKHGPFYRAMSEAWMRSLKYSWFSCDTARFPPMNNNIFFLYKQSHRGKLGNFRAKGIYTSGMARFNLNSCQAKGNAPI